MEGPKLDVMEAIHARRAVRSFEPRQPSDDQIRTVIDAAVHAPTAMHREPWVFAVVQSRELLHTISERVKTRWRRAAPPIEPYVAAAVPEARGFLEALARPGFNVFYDAGTLVLIGARPSSSFVQADCWLAAQNLMLAATSIGLGTCVIGSSIEELNTEETKRSIGIPMELIVVAPILLGFPHDIPPPTSRRLPEIVAWKR